MNAKAPELSLWLDDFDDIYSDFDSRHFLKRRVSEDFLHELELALAGKEKPASNLILLLPEDKRSVEKERDIVTNLQQFFKNQYTRCLREHRATFQKGLLLLLTGMCVMAADFIISYKQWQHIVFQLLRVLMEPCGWFLIWIGLEKLYYDVQKHRKEIARFLTLSKMTIHFASSE
ncbi:MAG TPA: hypothetical protein VL307_04395 [Chitinophagaceae bacterium]|nr:hypothetical protein [Chitinophagaceae bacterium]